MIPTHTYRRPVSGDRKPCELIAISGPLATIRIHTGCYWEAPRLTMLVVRTDELLPIPDDSTAREVSEHVGRRWDDLRAMLAMAREHGFHAWLGADRDSVMVEVDWVNATTGETGADLEVARSYREMRAVLGY